MSRVKINMNMMLGGTVEVMPDGEEASVMRLVDMPQAHTNVVVLAGNLPDTAEEARALLNAVQVEILQKMADSIRDELRARGVVRSGEETHALPINKDEVN